MAAVVAESRLPVGSSHSSSAGAPIRARAIATRWRSPPDSWVGRNSARWPSPTRSSAAAPGPRRLAPGRLPVDLGEHDVLDHRAVREQVEGLEDEADAAARSPARSSVATARRRRCPRSRYEPASGRSRHPTMFSSVDFPDPDGPTMASHSPSPHRQVDVDERVHRRVACVLLAQILQPDHHRRGCHRVTHQGLRSPPSC